MSNLPETEARAPRAIPNKFGRPCRHCDGRVPPTLLIVPRPEDTEANRTWLGCPDCDGFVAWANKDESGAEAKTCRSSEFPSAVRVRVMARDGYACQACGRRAPEVLLQLDHIVPAKEGGLSVEANGITLCQECNLGKGKGHTVLDAFRLWLKTVKEDMVDGAESG